MVNIVSGSDSGLMSLQTHSHLFTFQDFLYRYHNTLGDYQNYPIQRGLFSNLLNNVSETHKKGASAFNPYM